MKIITGCFGSGKSEISVQLALDAAAQGQQVALVDMDIVNPYFTSSQQREEMQQKGVEVVAPTFAGSGIDTPAIPPQMRAVMQRKQGEVIIDLGGDATGATVLGSFAAEAQGAQFLFVFNPYRPLTRDVDAALEMMQGIEQRARMRVTGLINNANMVGETTEEHLAYGEEQCRMLSERTGLPIVYHCVEQHRKDVPPLSGERITLTLRNRPDWLFQEGSI